jgi:hypothetical protein
MPVSCKLIDGEWKVTDADGKVHGSHGRDEDKCKKQARAINTSAEMSTVNALNQPNDCDIIQFEDDSTRFEKEHIYEGTFEKNGVKFEVNQEALSHLAVETNRYIGDGNKCNLPVRHTEDVEANRGEHERWFVKRDSRGRVGLFSILKFRDSDTAKIAKTAQTSIYCPPDHEVNGKKYIRPILHTALTDYPVVPGLDGFTPIAASLVHTIPDRKGDTEMPWKELAAALSLELSADAKTDEQIQKEVTLQFSNLKKSADEKKATDDRFSSVTLEFESYKKLNPPKTDPVRVSKAQIGMLKENRELKLSALVKEGKILPIVKTQLESVFCTDAVLTLCLSQDHEDNFNKIVEALKENDPIKLTEMTGAQIRDAVIYSLDPSKNPVQTVADRIAEQERKRLGQTG